MNNETKKLLKNIRLVVFDVDGVLTDGTLFYGENGEMIKGFHVRDGLALKLLPQQNIEVAVISAKRSAPLKKRLDDLSIKYQCLGVPEKKSHLQGIIDELNIQWHEVAYVGDDMVDLPVMSLCGVGIAVADAYCLVKENADLVTELAGGKGVAREVADLILKEQGLYEKAYALSQTKAFEQNKRP